MDRFGPKMAVLVILLWAVVLVGISAVDALGSGNFSDDMKGVIAATLLLGVFTLFPILYKRNRGA